MSSSAVLPKISVVTCCYNHAQFLERTLRSVLDQRYPALEYIVIDGGSTDGSADILRRYRHDLAYWVSESDRGQTDALIKGFARATGDICCWLCSDDLHEPWTLREVADYFGRHPRARVVYGDSLWIDVNDRVIAWKREHAFNRFIWMHDHNFIPQPSTFWRRDLYDEVGGLDATFDLAMDADLWIRFAEITTLDHVRRPWSRMRYYPDQKVRRLRDRGRDEDRIIRSRYLGPHSEWTRRALFVCAKGFRIGLKLLNEVMYERS
jgi:glycosyltransferase involved in cell wall biosynthesis